MRRDGVSDETYLLGVVVLVAVVGPLRIAARRLRARVVPDWSGAPAWIADVVVGLALLEAGAQLLGTVGQFRRGPLVAAALGTWLAVFAATSPRRGRSQIHELSSRRATAGENQRMRLGAWLAIALGLTVIVSIPWLA